MRSCLATKSITLRLALVLLIAASLGLAGLKMREALPDWNWGDAVFVISFLALSVGLALMKAWARQATVVLLWLFVIIVPFGYINPFAASDLGRDAPPVEHLIAWILPAVAIALFFLHILGKYKGEFASGRAVT